MQVCIRTWSDIPNQTKATEPNLTQPCASWQTYIMHWRISHLATCECEERFQIQSWDYLKRTKPRRPNSYSNSHWLADVRNGTEAFWNYNTIPGWFRCCSTFVVMRCVVCCYVLRCLLCRLSCCTHTRRMLHIVVCCNVLQCVAHCSVYQTYVAWHLLVVLIHCHVLQCVAMCCNVLQCVAMCCNVLQCVAHCSVLQSVTVCCSVLPVLVQQIIVCYRVA